MSDEGDDRLAEQVGEHLGRPYFHHVVAAARACLPLRATERQVTSAARAVLEAAGRLVEERLRELSREVPS